MAKFIGSNVATANYGEDVFCKMLIDSFPDNYIIYRNRQVFGREFDMAMLIPDVGIVVFEIKGWRESTVLRVENGDSIVIATDEGEKKASPQKQVRGYRFAIERRLRQDLGAVPVVFCMVVYPQISKDFFVQKGMDKVSEPQFTVLKEDMNSASALLSKLANAANEVQLWHRAKFDEEFMYNTRCLFESDLTKYADRPNEEIPKFAQPEYSKFFFYPGNAAVTEDVLDKICKLYGQGTKIYAVVGTLTQLRQIVCAIDQALNKKSLYRVKGNLYVRYQDDQVHYPTADTLMGSFTTFNCTISILTHPVNCGGFVLTDGIENEHHNDLVQISDASEFNYDQFAVEHTPVEKNIEIRAGAGTGKTFTMVSRIGFIAHSCAGSLLDLLDRVTMITFTNEAADQMRKKLKTFFRNCFLLTENKAWLILVSKIDQMQISTIHSYAKKLVEVLGAEYGYGCDVSITSSDFNRRVYVSDMINSYIEEHRKTQKDFVEKLNIPMYQLIKDVVDFIQKLQNKSIDVTRLSPENFGSASNLAQGKELHELLCCIIPRVEQEYQSKLLEGNRVHLSSIMSMLQMLMQDPRCQERIRRLKKTSLSYMFVDEFQDTDNTQIRILVKLCELLNSKMFVVGDVKQCIYRFRGATEEAFDQLPIKGHETEWASYALRRNYRTDARLLQLFDKSFSNWGAPNARLLVYRPQKDRLLGSKNYNDSMPAKEFYHCTHILSDDGRMEALFDEIDRIQKRIDQDRKRGVKLSEEERTIAILVRENWQAEEIKRAGRERHQVIHTNTGGDLYQTPPAIDMLSLANALLHYDEPKYLFSLLTSNFFHLNISYSVLYRIRKDVEQTSWMDDGEKNKMRNTLIDSINHGLVRMPPDLNTWEQIIVALRTRPVLQIMHILYEKLKPEYNYSEDDEKEQQYYRMNVDLLLERVLAACNADGLTINSFAKSLSICVTTGVSENSRIVTSENRADIQCITVHKAKGLEYGHVIVPYGAFRIDRLKRAKLDVSVEDDVYPIRVGYKLERSDKNDIYQNTFYNEQIEAQERSREETRILYVAMTRAIRSFSWIVQDDRQALSWQNIIQQEGDR